MQNSGCALLISVEHAISDGISLGHLCHSLLEAIAAATVGKLPSRAALPRAVWGRTMEAACKPPRSTMGLFECARRRVRRMLAPKPGVFATFPIAPHNTSIATLVNTHNSYGGHVELRWVAFIEIPFEQRVRPWFAGICKLDYDSQSRHPRSVLSRLQLWL